LIKSFQMIPLKCCLCHHNLTQVHWDIWSTHSIPSRDILIATSSFQLASGLCVTFALPPRSSWYRWQSMHPRNPPIQKTGIHVNVWEYCHRHPSAYVACYISWARFLVWSHWSTPLDHQQCGTHTWDRLREACSHWCNWAFRL